MARGPSPTSPPRRRPRPRHRSRRPTPPTPPPPRRVLWWWGTVPPVAESDRPPGPPTADNPAVLYIIGDSDAGSIGPSLQRLASKTGVVKSVLDYKVSSGLTRPDFFDWPKHVQKKVPEVGPQIVVVTFGGNDAQPIKAQNGKTYQVSDPEWKAEYERRVGAAMDFLGADGRKVIWVGHAQRRAPTDLQRPSAGAVGGGEGPSGQSSGRVARRHLGHVQLGRGVRRLRRRRDRQSGQVDARRRRLPPQLRTAPTNWLAPSTPW